jgi:hypothetical protein
MKPARSSCIQARFAALTLSLAMVGCAPRSWVVRQDHAAMLRESERFAVLPLEAPQAEGPPAPTEVEVELRRALETSLARRGGLALTVDPDGADFVIRPRLLGPGSDVAAVRGPAVWMEVYIEDRNGWVLDIVRTGRMDRTASLLDAAEDVAEHVLGLTAD